MNNMREQLSIVKREIKKSKKAKNKIIEEELAWRRHDRFSGRLPKGSVIKAISKRLEAAGL